MTRPQGRPKSKRDPWDFEGPYDIVPLRWWRPEEQLEVTGRGE